MLFLIAVVGRSCCFSGPVQFVVVDRLGSSTRRVGSAICTIVYGFLMTRYQESTGMFCTRGQEQVLVCDLGDVKESRG